MAPIAMFVYARPEHTQRTLESLAANKFADQSELIVFADGPKEGATAETLEAIERTRAIVTEKDWCGKVTLVASDENKGLAKSIVSGVTKLVNERGRVIVLEDDLFLSPGFLEYMNTALNLYEHEERVLHISGYMFPVKSDLPETVFYNTASCWGWGTWKRAWVLYDGDSCDHIKQIKERGLEWKFNIEGTHEDFMGQLVRNCSGQASTWAINWYASMLLNSGFSLHPGKSLVRNMGYDGSGANSGVDHKISEQEITSAVKVETIPLVEEQYVRKAMQKFYLNLYPSFRTLIRYQIKKLIHHLT